MVLNSIPIRTKAIMEFLQEDPSQEYVYCGPAYRYTQVIVDQCCNKLGKKFYSYTCRLDDDNTIDQLTNVKEFPTIAEAWKEAKDHPTATLWTDQHIEYMVKYLYLPNIKECWLPYTSGTILRAALKANPETIFRCVDTHYFLGLDQTKYPNDYHRISTKPYYPYIKTIKGNRVYNYTKKGDFIII